MTITFRRIDYAQVGTTSNGCLRVINIENDAKNLKKIKSYDKIVVGAQDGVLHCFEQKNNEIAVNLTFIFIFFNNKKIVYF